MRFLALVVLVTSSLALFGCPDKNAGPDPAASAKATTSAAVAGSAHPAAAGAASAKGGW